jgi:Ni2+-binding GTPase involved in maturation of urease and hydrogenase
MENNNKTDLVKLAEYSLKSIKVQLKAMRENVNLKTADLFPEMEESEFIKKQKEEKLNRH